MLKPAEHINHVYDQLLRVKERLENLNLENENLKEKNKKLLEDLERLSKENIRMEATLTSVEQNKESSSGELLAYKHKIKKEIEGYAKQVDKCLELVSQS